MELIYHVALEAQLNGKESTLLYKYLSLHPQHKTHISKGYFAHGFNAVPAEEELFFTLTKDVLDICVTVLEDQHFGDPSENEQKGKIIDKFYCWTKIIYDEEESIDNFKQQFDILKCCNLVAEDEDFSLETYLRIKSSKSPSRGLKTSFNKSLFSRIKEYFQL